MASLDRGRVSGKKEGREDERTVTGPLTPNWVPLRVRLN